MGEWERLINVTMRERVINGRMRERVINERMREIGKWENGRD